MLSQNLLQLRQQRGLSQAAVANKACLSLPAYRNIEMGRAAPKAETIQRLAKALDVCLRELLAPNEALRAVRFRALKQMKRRGPILSDVKRWLTHFNELEDLLDDHTLYAFDPLATELSRDEPGAKAVIAAHKARHMLGLDADEPIRDICGLLESGGVKIYPIKLASEDFFGLSVAPQGGGPAIVVNTYDRISVERWIFSAAHEFGHLLLHLDSFDADAAEEINAQEAEANVFASHFLMPQAAFKKEWQETYGLPLVVRVLKLKRIFRVSYRTVLYRLIECEEYSGTLWRDFQSAYRRLHGKTLLKSDEPEALSADNFLASAPEFRHAQEPAQLDPYDFVENRLWRLVRKGVESGRISLSYGAEVLGLRLNQMRQIVAAW